MDISPSKKSSILMGMDISALKNPYYGNVISTNFCVKIHTKGCRNAPLYAKIIGPVKNRIKREFSLIFLELKFDIFPLEYIKT